jgi:hypothetical protein
LKQSLRKFDLPRFTSVGFIIDRERGAGLSVGQTDRRGVAEILMMLMIQMPALSDVGSISPNRWRYAEGRFAARDIIAVDGIEVGDWITSTSANVSDHGSHTVTVNHDVSD